MVLPVTATRPISPAPTCRLRFTSRRRVDIPGAARATARAGAGGGVAGGGGRAVLGPRPRGGARGGRQAARRPDGGGAELLPGSVLGGAARGSFAPHTGGARRDGPVEIVEVEG